MFVVDNCLAVEDADRLGVGGEDVLLLYFVPALEFEYGYIASGKE